jgi:hypothetical protein
MMRELEMIAELQLLGIEFQNAQEKTFGNNVNKIVGIFAMNDDHKGLLVIVGTRLEIIG